MRVIEDLRTLPASQWNALATAAGAGHLQPFLRHEFLCALADSNCTGERSGWIERHLVFDSKTDQAPLACVPLYLKTHSWGEYVFDWAWADAYERHGLQYYPKLVSAVPFTPVSGPRLLVSDPASRRLVARALVDLANSNALSSLHVLFTQDADAAALAEVGAMSRDGVQFHWRNQGWRDFDDFLSALSQPKRKKIRAERRKIAEQGVVVERLHGTAIRERHWALFTDCYANTYAAHGARPYLNQRFFEQIGATMPQHLVLVLASVDGKPIAASLLVIDEARVYGRYWGAIAHVPLLHFELCYYQAIELALELGLRVVEGGAQGEHKMARGFEPVTTRSMHWLREPAFADAVDRFLGTERNAISGYVDELDERSAFRKQAPP